MDFALELLEKNYVFEVITLLHIKERKRKNMLLGVRVMNSTQVPSMFKQKAASLLKHDLEKILETI